MTETVTTTRSRFPEIREQKDSLEDLIGVRSIMVEQESLFKEQVQALHRLYKVQKLEMQEFENKKKHLTTLETAELTDGFSSISQSEDKSGALVRPVARVYKPETGSLSLHPFCSLKLFEGSGSATFGGSFQRPDASQSKQVKNFDLERFPEGWVDESSLVIQSDDSCPTSKESEVACVEESVKTDDTSEEGLLTISSGKVVSSDTEGNQGSSPADPMDRKAKLSHQDSFASVNGYLSSSSSEGEENNCKIAAAFKMTEGITVAKVDFPKMELFYDGQTPRSGPQCASSEGHSIFLHGSADRQPWSLKTDSKHASERLQSSELTSGAAHLLSHRKTGVETQLTKGGRNEYTQAKRAAGTSAGPAPKNSIDDVQQLPVQGKAETDPEASVFRASSNEGFNPSKKRHWDSNTDTKAGLDNKLMNISKHAKMSPSRSTP